MSRLLTFLTLAGVSTIGLLMSGGTTATAKSADRCCSGGACQVCTNCECRCVAGCNCCDTGVCVCGDDCACQCCAEKAAVAKTKPCCSKGSGEAALLAASNVTFTGAAAASCCSAAGCNCADGCDCCVTGDCGCKSCDCACCAAR